MTRQTYIAFAGAGSLTLLLGALIFQALGYAPCMLCVWQRWPHAMAVGVAGVALWDKDHAFWPVLGALCALTTAGIGGYHAGVEQGWWAGPSVCAGGGDALSGLSGADLLSTAAPETIIRCDEIAWMFLGLSMATWNMVMSLGLALVWFYALRVPKKGRKPLSL